MHLDPSLPETSSAFLWKLWIYTNYDCNLKCSYCVAKSGPNAPRRALGIENVKRLVDEAVELGFEHIFFTGGEPFLLNEIYEMLAYSAARIKTTVLTNAMLLHGVRLEKLCAIAHENLIIQVSLDGGRPEDHDAYRGPGTWEKTMEGIKLLQARDFAFGLERPKRRLIPRIWTNYANFIARSEFQMKIISSARWRNAAIRARAWNWGWATLCLSLLSIWTVFSGIRFHDADMQVNKNISRSLTSVRSVSRRTENLKVL